MGFSIGGSASKTKTTSDRTATSTRTPIIPEWASNLTQGVAGRVGSLTSVDPQSLVAPAHGLQSQAANTAQNLGGQLWNHEGAIDVARGVASSNWLDNYMQAPATPAVRGESLLDNLSAYMSPYTKDVVDAALADFDHGAGQTRAQQDLDLAGSGAFGGSGAALTRSMTEDAILRGRASTSANLRDQAFNRGAALSSEDANRRQQAAALNAQVTQQDWNQRVSQYMAGQDQRLRAADQLAGLANGYEANQRANITAQAELGDALRGIEQDYRQAPITSTQQLVAMLSGLPLALFAGEQTNETEHAKTTSKKKGVSATLEGSWPSMK
ncbi:hypothetical protein [Phenylobacterium sp.]|uniref:hypothetical protein n=1 Tax=Phenylobacterium sp. TaxID=1871053 RepID=UPI0028121FB8|nr:hypothetical protein [Phenylobacterium sp.]